MEAWPSFPAAIMVSSSIIIRILQLLRTPGQHTLGVGGHSPGYTQWGGEAHSESWVPRAQASSQAPGSVCPPASSLWCQSLSSLGQGDHPSRTSQATRPALGAWVLCP